MCPLSKLQVAMRVSQREVAKSADASVLDLITKADGNPLKAAGIIAALSTTHSRAAVNQALLRLAQNGQITRPKFGWYVIADDE